MHSRYPIRKSVHRDPPGVDNARISGATAQKIPKAIEIDGGGGEMEKLRHGKRVGHILANIEQSMPPLQQPVADNEQPF